MRQCGIEDAGTIRRRFEEIAGVVSSRAGDDIKIDIFGDVTRPFIAGEFLCFVILFVSLSRVKLIGVMMVFDDDFVGGTGG